MVLQTPTVQIKYGDGKVVLHILSCQVADGAGHKSDHYDVIQSWYPIPVIGNDDTQTVAVGGAAVDPAASRAGDGAFAEEGGSCPGGEACELDDEEDLADVTEADAAVLRKRLDILGARTAAEDTAALYAQLDERLDELNKEDPDDPSSDQSIPCMVSDRLTWLAKRMPGWDGRLHHVALAVLFLYRCRMADLSLPEYVVLTHVALGHGERLLVAHDSMPFFWNARLRAWEHFEGLVPHNVLVFLKNYFLQVEGVLRSFTGDVKRSDEAVVAAIDAAYKQHGGDSGAMTCKPQTAPLVHKISAYKQ